MSFSRAASSAAIVALLSVVSATAKPIATTAETNLRKGPGTDSEVLTLIPKGGVVEVGDCTNGWCAASFDGKDGYVIARNVGMGPRPAPRGRRMGAVQVTTRGRPMDDEFTDRRCFTARILTMAILTDGAIESGDGATGDDPQRASRDNMDAARARCSIAGQAPAAMSDDGATQEPPTATTFGCASHSAAFAAPIPPVGQ